MSVVVVLPTYNERDCVARAVAAVLAARCRPDVLVVDDSSPDGTGEVVRGLRDPAGRLRLLERPGKEGLGKAYAAGFAHVLTDWPHDTVVQMDVDGSHDAADVDRLVAAVTNGADLALGSRYVAGGDVSGWSRGRELLSRGGNTYARLLLGSPLRDLTGGFKAWRATTLAAIDVDSVRSAGYGFQIEMTMQAVRDGARVVELPITFRDRELGTSKMSGRIAMEALLGVPRMRNRVR